MPQANLDGDTVAWCPPPNYPGIIRDVPTLCHPASLPDGHYLLDTQERVIGPFDTVADLVDYAASGDLGITAGEDRVHIVNGAPVRTRPVDTTYFVVDSGTVLYHGTNRVEAQRIASRRRDLYRAEFQDEVVVFQATPMSVQLRTVAEANHLAAMWPTDPGQVTVGHRDRAIAMHHQLVGAAGHAIKVGDDDLVEDINGAYQTLHRVCWGRPGLHIRQVVGG